MPKPPILPVCGCDRGADICGIKSEVYMQALGGTLGTIYIIGEQNDAASAQAAQAKIMADEGYWALALKLVDVIADPPTMAFLQPV